MASAHAFSFEPITQDYTPSGPGANHVFRVANTSASRIAVRISVRPRSIEPDGTEILGKEADEFVVFPRQILLDPGERRGIRVSWNGPASLEVERPFRVIAEQVPVAMGRDEPTQGGGIRLTYRYEGSIYVVPFGAESAVRVATVERVAGGLLVGIENTGTRRAILSSARLFVSGAGGSQSTIELGPAELPGLTGENMLAGARRLFIVPAPAGLPDGPLTGRIVFDTR